MIRFTLRDALIPLACIGVVAAMGPSAWADVVGTTTSTVSTTESVVFNPATTTTLDIKAYSTQLIGRIVGGSTVYDQTFAFPYANPAVQAGKTTAIAAVTTAGGPGVVIGAPVLSASSSNTVSYSVTNYALAGTTQIEQAGVLVFGPGSILTGPRTVCVGITALPGPTAPTCSIGTATNLILNIGDVNVNVNTDTVYTINQSTLTTNTTTLFEQYTISGIVQAVGGEQAGAVSALGDENRRFNDAMLSRILSGGTLGGIVPAGDGNPGNGWAQGFGWTGKAVSDSRSGAGLDGGMNVDLSEHLRAGFGVSHGWVNVSLDDGSGSAAVDITELGLAARYSDQGFYAAATGVAGFGSGKANGLVSSQNFSMSLFAASGELGYAIPQGDMVLTPNIGGQWTQINTGSFTGSGSAPLVSSGSNNGFGKAWAGIKLNGQHEALSFAAYGRLAAYSNENISVPVSFLGSATILPITAKERSNLGLEAGLSASVALASNLEAFAAYDLRLRGDTAIHAGTVGFALKW